jgi:peptidyl-prolyl cis-trans isomerase C
MTLSHFTTTVAVALLITGCAQQSTPGGSGAAPKVVDIVAVVDGHSISRNTFNHYAQGAGGKPAAELTAEQRTELLDNLIRGELVAQDAERSGLAAQDETRAVMDLSRLSVLQQAASQNFLKDRKPGDEELRAEYDLQVARMPHTQFRASHILVPTEAAAKKLIDQLGHGGNFAQLAKQNSTDAGSRDRGGDLDWFTPDSMTPPFAEALKQLKKGQTTAAPVKTQFGWHVIRLVDARDTPAPAFDTVKDRLVQIVESRKFKAYTDTLVAKAKITKSL